MRHELIGILSKTLNNAIACDLVDNYSKMKKNFIYNEYEAVQSISGKFAENVFRSLHFIALKTDPKEIKPTTKKALYRALKDSSAPKRPESIRILIPRATELLYTARSKMGAVHQKPITPDYIDAKLTIDISNWIVAELLRQSDIDDTLRLEQLINSVMEEQILIVQKVGSEFFIDADVSCEDEILIRLYINPNLPSKSDLVGSIRNFTRRHIDRSLCKLVKERKIALTQDNKYVIYNSAKKAIGRKMIQLSQS